MAVLMGKIWSYSSSLYFPLKNNLFWMHRKLLYIKDFTVLFWYKMSQIRKKYLHFDAFVSNICLCFKQAAFFKGLIALPNFVPRKIS